MRNRLIAVPISKAAERRLDYDECYENDLIEYKLSEEEFSKLYKIGFFKELNNSLSLMIGDYEWEEIVGDKLYMLESFMSKYMKNHPNISILNEINKLFKVAYEKETGIYFFF